MKTPLWSNCRKTSLAGATLVGLSVLFVHPAHAQEPVASVAEAAPTIVRVEITGTRAISSARLITAVEKVVKGKSGNRETLLDAATAAIALYRSEGYTVAQVVGSEVTPDGTLRLTIAEGTIRRVLIKGNSKTQTRVIRLAMDIYAGDVYQAGRIRDGRNRLALLGIFEDIVVAPLLPGESDEEEKQEQAEKAAREAEEKARKEMRNPPPTEPPIIKGTGGEEPPAGEKPAEEKPAEQPAPEIEKPTPLAPDGDEVGLVDLVIRVKERRTGNIAATVGYSDGSGVVGFVDLSEDNLYGTAHRASVQWQRFTQGRIDDEGQLVDARSRSAYRVDYDVPVLAPRSVAFGGSLYDTNTVFLPFFFTNQETIRSYEVRRGGRFKVGQNVGQNGVSMFFTARRDEIGYDPIPDRLNPPINEVNASFGTVSAFGFEIVADARDDIYSPTRGHWRDITYEKAGNYFGGDQNFSLTKLDLRQYVPLSKAPKNTPVLAGRLVAGFSTGDVPLAEQFFIGGFEYLRGYEIFSIRGDRMLVASLEGRLPIGPGIQAAIFTDIGNAWKPNEKMTLTDVKASLGAGLRFLTPIGPIRLDVAYGSRVQTYISLGHSY